jgi:Na+/H+ antiporter NhaA
VLVVNELVALVLIAALYSHDLDLTALAWGATFVAMIAAMRALGVPSSIPCVLLGVAAWVALHESGVEPVVLGLALGLLVGARPVSRPELHRATERFRRFREQPTPQLERSARDGLRAAIPPNERLLALYHPWTSYAIVPLFALANAGIAIDGELLRRAAGSPVTMGVLRRPTLEHRALVGAVIGSKQMNGAPGGENTCAAGKPTSKLTRISRPPPATVNTEPSSMPS